MHQDCQSAEAVTACNAVQVEAGAAKDELKRLRKEMLRLKNEWTTLRALYESAKVCYLHVKQTSAFAASEADQILTRPYCAEKLEQTVLHIISSWLDLPMMARRYSAIDTVGNFPIVRYQNLLQGAMTIWSPKGRYPGLRRILQPSKANTVTSCADGDCITRTIETA